MSTTVRASEPEHLGLLAAGYVMAFALPIGGVVVGFLLTERRTGHAVAILMLSVWTAMVYAWLLLHALA